MSESNYLLEQLAKVIAEREILRDFAWRFHGVLLHLASRSQRPVKCGPDWCDLENVSVKDIHAAKETIRDFVEYTTGDRANCEDLLARGKPYDFLAIAEPVCDPEEKGEEQVVEA